MRKDVTGCRLSSNRNNYKDFVKFLNKRDRSKDGGGIKSRVLIEGT